MLAVEHDVAFKRRQHAADQSQQRRFAAARAAHDRDDLAARKRHGHVVQHDATAVVAKRYVIDLNERVVSHLLIVRRARMRLRARRRSGAHCRTATTVHSRVSGNPKTRAARRRTGRLRQYGNRVGLNRCRQSACTLAEARIGPADTAGPCPPPLRKASGGNYQPGNTGGK